MSETKAGNAAPPASVLGAFGIVGPPTNLRGGRGHTWATPSVVLKPVDDEAEAVWVAELAARLERTGFRLALPIATTDGRWIVEGWCAWTRVPGEHRTDRWAELLTAAQAFHGAVAGVAKPEFIERRVDRWRVADRVAWGELPWEDFAAITHVAPLVAARRPLGLASQLIHGDLVGNVLFADELAPAIIDLSLYWRPPGYSAALVVGDALAWEGAAPSIIELLAPLEEWPQLLLRAVIFRVVVNELARRIMPWREDLSEHYRPLVELTLSRARGRG